MSISQVVVFFMIYSFIGWLWEMIYTPIEEKNFQNRGFLFGPICPIYGFCILILQFLMRNVPIFTSDTMTTPKLFLICLIGSAIIEFSTSWIMEVIFHARWWDYSNFPLNIDGRICLPASIFFGLVGILLVNYVFPATDLLMNIVPSVVFETTALIMMVIFGADYALTQASLTSLLQKIENANKEFIDKGESVYQAIVATPSNIKSKIEATPSNIKSKIEDYEAETREKARLLAESLSEPQRVLLSRITKFSNKFGFSSQSDTKEKTNIGNKLKEYYHTIRNARK